MRELRLRCALLAAICLGAPEVRAAADAFSAGWSSNLVFTVVDRAEVIKTQDGETTTNRLEVKFLMYYRGETNGLFSLSWRRATPLNIDGHTSGHPVFNALAPGLEKMWTSMPPLMIDDSGMVVGLGEDGGMAQALGNFIGKIDPSHGAQLEQSFSETMSSSRARELMQQAIAKHWNLWVLMWDWDTEVPELEELLGETEPAEVRMELMAPMVVGGDSIATTLVFELKERREDGRLHLAHHTTYPFSEETGRAVFGAINSVAADDTKIDEAEMIGSKFGKTVSVETVIDPATLRPDWVKVREETKAVEASGKAMVKIEGHEYTFNYQPTEDDLRPGARATREYMDEIDLQLAQQERRARIFGYIAMPVVLSVVVGIALFVVWLRRRWRRRKHQPQ